MCLLGCVFPTLADFWSFCECTCVGMVMPKQTGSAPSRASGLWQRRQRDPAKGWASIMSCNGEASRVMLRMASATVHGLPKH